MDTGALYALVDRDDVWHARVRSWWTQTREEILVPVTVLPEITHLVGQCIGTSAEIAFARSVASGEFPLEPLMEEDLARIAEIMAIYADTPIGFVDASLVTIAERLGVVRLLTTDRRHLSLVRPHHTSAFQLVP
ncbi:MAG: type II toxin-antitoxin system VapC family toxin [Gemmatimonadaceae bacterium]